MLQAVDPTIRLNPAADAKSEILQLRRRRIRALGPSGDQVMGAPFKKLLGDCVMDDPCSDPNASMPVASGMRRFSFLLALTLAFIGSAQPVAAKVVVKKGVYGAIALQRETGQLGYAYDSATSRAAKIEALKQCADPRCEVVTAFSNACGALARGPKKYFPATGATRQEPDAKALRLCAARECEIVAWACTK